MDTGSKQQKQVFDDLNLFDSQVIETILVSLRTSHADEALLALSQQEAILIEKTHLDRFREHLTRYQQNQKNFEEAIAEIKLERDTLLGAVNHLYQTFRFVFEAIHTAKTEKPKPSALSSLISALLRALGMGKMDSQTMVIVEQILKKIKGNIPAITENMQKAIPQLEPALGILIKHNIVEKNIIDGKED